MQKDGYHLVRRGSKHKNGKQHAKSSGNGTVLGGNRFAALSTLGQDGSAPTNNKKKRNRKKAPPPDFEKYKLESLVDTIIEHHNRKLSHAEKSLAELQRRLQEDDTILEAFQLCHDDTKPEEFCTWLEAIAPKVKLCHDLMKIIQDIFDVIWASKGTGKLYFNSKTPQRILDARELIKAAKIFILPADQAQQPSYDANTFKMSAVIELMNALYPVIMKDQDEKFKELQAKLYTVSEDDLAECTDLSELENKVTVEVDGPDNT